MRVRNRLAFGIAFLLSCSSAAAAQPPTEAGSPAAENSETLVLLRNGGVQDELGLDPAQRDRLLKLPAEIRAKHKKNLDDLRQLVTEVKEKAAKAQEDFFKDVDAAADRILKPEQARRLKQIGLQRQGPGMFADPEVAAALRLTDEQKAAQAKIVAGLAKAQEDLFAKGGARLAAKEIAELSRKAQEAMVATLSEEQKKVFQGLVGEPTAVTGRFLPFGMHLTPDALRRAGKVTLLVDPKLAGELKLAEGQAADLKTALEEAGAKLQKGMLPPGGIPPQFLAAQIEQKMAAEAAREALEEILKPDQKRRFEQIALQARGLIAFEDIAVLRALKLTPEQARTVEEAGVVLARTRQVLLQEAKDFKEAQKVLRESEFKLNREAVAGVVADFDEAQKKEWQERTGKAFDFGKAGVDPLGLGARQTALVVPGAKGSAGAPVSPARAFFNDGNAAYFRSEFGKALAAFDECLRLDPDNAFACNSKAWLLATCPEDERRDGLEAIRLAKKACELTKDKVASFLDTLAAAYAEAGEFEEAVTAQTRALEIAAPQERAEFAARLKLFREKKKYREMPGKGGV
jgi:tetratricopeptide (TPR) repeat protein